MAASSLQPPTIEARRTGLQTPLNIHLKMVVRGKYGREKKSSILAHNQDSVGAVPTSATI